MDDMIQLVWRTALLLGQSHPRLPLQLRILMTLSRRQNHPQSQYMPHHHQQLRLPPYPKMSTRKCSLARTHQNHLPLPCQLCGPTPLHATSTLRYPSTRGMPLTRRSLA